ncbi:MAG: MFS transporter [Acidobacteriota bacterium]
MMRARELTLLLVSTLTVMAGATIAPALPAIQEAFADTPSAPLLTRLVLSLPALFIVLGAPLIGIAIDRWGRLKPLFAVTVLYAVAGASATVANSLLTILIGRAILGIAIAGILTTATTLIADYYQGPERARMLGLQGVFTALGGMLFVVLGGVLADVSWRAPFLVYLLSLPLLIPMALALNEPRRESTATIPMGWRGAQAFMWIYLIGWLAQTGFYLVPTQLPYHLEALVGATGTQSGMAIAITTISAAVAAALYGRLRGRIGYEWIVIVVFATMALGYGAIGIATGWPLIIVGLATAGFGLGLVIPNLNNWLTDIAPETLRGRAVGGLTTAMFLGQFTSPLVSQPLVDTQGYSFTWKATAIVLVVATVAALTRDLLVKKHTQGA